MNETVTTNTTQVTQEEYESISEAWLQLTQYFSELTVNFAYDAEKNNRINFNVPIKDFYDYCYKVIQSSACNILLEELITHRIGTDYIKLWHIYRKRMIAIKDTEASRVIINTLYNRLISRDQTIV